MRLIMIGNTVHDTNLLAERAIAGTVALGEKAVGAAAKISTAGPSFVGDRQSNSTEPEPGTDSSNAIW